MICCPILFKVEPSACIMSPAGMTPIRLDGRLPSVGIIPSSAGFISDPDVVISSPLKGFNASFGPVITTPAIFFVEPSACTISPAGIPLKLDGSVPSVVVIPSEAGFTKVPVTVVIRPLKRTSAGFAGVIGCPTLFIVEPSACTMSPAGRVPLILDGSVPSVVVIPNSEGDTRDPEAVVTRPLNCTSSGLAGVISCPKLFLVEPSSCTVSPGPSTPLSVDGNVPNVVVIPSEVGDTRVP